MSVAGNTLGFLGAKLKINANIPNSHRHGLFAKTGQPNLPSMLTHYVTPANAPLRTGFPRPDTRRPCSHLGLWCHKLESSLCSYGSEGIQPLAQLHRCTNEIVSLRTSFDSRSSSTKLILRCAQVPLASSFPIPDYKGLASFAHDSGGSHFPLLQTNKFILTLV